MLPWDSELVSHVDPIGEIDARLEECRCDLQRFELESECAKWRAAWLRIRIMALERRRLELQR